MRYLELMRAKKHGGLAACRSRRGGAGIRNVSVGRVTPFVQNTLLSIGT
jgi:hypothetical protein